MLEYAKNLPMLTQGMIVIILVLTVWLAALRYNHRSLAYGPTILTTIGIFGCFLGIAIGLMEFDTRNIQGSVPALVQGIKTSFWTSVFGIGGALIIKLRHLVFGAPSLAPGEAEGATVDDLAALLHRLNSALGGAEDTSLISQTKLLRQDVADRLTGLRTVLESWKKWLTTIQRH